MVNFAWERARKTSERCSFYVGSKRAEKKGIAIKLEENILYLKTRTFCIAEMCVV